MNHPPIDFPTHPSLRSAAIAVFAATLVGVAAGAVATREASRPQPRPLTMHGAATAEATPSRGECAAPTTDERFALPSEPTPADSCGCN